ncbi:hypothetical protein TSOC_015261, partial [Tetrabaena socialis]
DGRTALQLANGHKEVVEVLLRAGGDVAAAKDKASWRCRELLDAAKKGTLQAVERLLSNPTTNPNVQDY